MGDTAGYAAVVGIGQEAIQAFLRVLYAAGKIAHRVPLESPVVGPSGDAGHLSGDFFLSLPELRLSADAGGQALLDLGLYGELKLGFQDADSFNGPVAITATVAVTPTFKLTSSAKNAKLVLGIDGATATLQQLEIQSGSGPFPSEVEGFLGGPIFNFGFQQAVQTQLAKLAGAPLDAAFLGRLVVAPTKAVTPQILDGTLLAAIDVTWGDAQPAANVTGVDTAGDASRLRDIRRGFDLACLVDPAQVPAVFADVKHDAAAAVQEQHAHLDSFEILAGPGGLHVNLVASNSKGTAQVAFDLVPTLTSEEFEHWKEVLRFSTENIVVHIEPGAGGKVLEILTLGIGIGYVDMEAESMRGNIEREIEVKGQSKPRNGQFTLPKTHKPKISTRIESYEIAETNVFIGISLTAHLGRYQLWGDSARYAVNGRASVHVGETLVVPYDVFRDDPRLRVRWVVQRLDTNEPVDVVDEAGHLSYRAQLPFDSPEPPPLNVSCRAYLVIGTASQELYNRTDTLVPSAIDPKPFIRWSHDVGVPSVKVEKDGSLTEVGFSVIKRYTRIHRTDPSLRCLFATRFPGGFTAPDIEYLDDLPFPSSDLAHHRRRVCDYCFYGGPDKTTPLQ